MIGTLKFEIMGSSANPRLSLILLVASTLLSVGAGPATQPGRREILPPLATAPEALGKAALIPIPYRTWLPPARVAREQRVVQTDGHHAIRLRPAIDLPPIAEYSGSLPSEVHLAVLPGVRIVSPNPAVLPVATIAAKPDSGSPTLGTDSTLNLAPSAALRLVPVARSTSIPPLLVPVPDPDRQPGHISGEVAHPEGVPISTFDRPSSPSLPVAK